MPEEKDYKSFPYDRLTPGSELKIERTVYYDKYDISDLVQNTPEQLQAMIDESIKGENIAFRIVQAAANQWEETVAKTQLLSRAMTYLKTPSAEHTGNQWIDGKDGEHIISNMVYKMTCCLKENEIR